MVALHYWFLLAEALLVFVITVWSTKLKYQACCIEKILTVNWYFSYKQTGNCLLCKTQQHSLRISGATSIFWTMKMTESDVNMTHFLWILTKKSSLLFIYCTPLSPLKTGKSVDFKNPAINFSSMSSSNIYFYIFKYVLIV